MSGGVRVPIVSDIRRDDGWEDRLLANGTYADDVYPLNTNVVVDLGNPLEDCKSQY